MITRTIKKSFCSVGSLYTWGETTYGWGREVNDKIRVPGQVGTFKNVHKVAAGPYHLLFGTQSKEVYSVGLGSNGRLGHGTSASLDEPQLIQALNNVEIKKLAAGCRHSLALSASGDVYSWGYGGRTGGVFKYLSFLESDSPLGQGQTGDVHKPQIVESLKQKIKQIAAGSDLSIAVGQSGKVYGWGCGLSCLGQQTSSKPIQLDQINYFLDSHHAHVKTVKSSGANVFFLLDDGRIYSVGQNKAGAFGTRRNPKVMLDQNLNSLTKIVDEDLSGQKIVKFKISNNSLIFLTDSGRVYYSGMYSKFRPERFPVKQGSVKTIFATYDSVGVVDNEGRIGYVNDEFIENSERKGKVFVSKDQHLMKNTVKIGGPYKLRYALVQNN